MANNLNVISDMKQVILRSILSDEDIVKILRNSHNVQVPDIQLRYTQVFPWMRTFETVEEAKSFITFEVAVTRVQNCAVREFELRIYIMTHESLMLMNGQVCGELGLDASDCGTRIDVLADKIDYLINGSEELGFGKIELIASPPFTPAEKFLGRILVYHVEGWNRWGEKL